MTEHETSPSASREGDIHVFSASWVGAKNMNVPLWRINLCPVFDCGESDGITYLAMAYIEGPTLGEWYKDERPRPPKEAAALVVKLAQAMEAAHKAGVEVGLFAQEQEDQVRQAGTRAGLTARGSGHGPMQGARGG